MSMLVLPSKQMDTPDFKQLANDFPVDPTGGDQQYGGMSFHKPGLKVRVTQALSDLIKENLLQYGVAYLNWDLHIPASGVKPIKMFPIYTDIHYTDLRYDQFKFDIDSAALNFTHMAVDNKAVVYIELPQVKRWDIAFEYFFDLLWFHQGTMELRLKDASAIATVELKATSDGHIYPHLHDFMCDISKATLENESWHA